MHLGLHGFSSVLLLCYLLQPLSSSTSQASTISASTAARSLQVAVENHPPPPSCAGPRTGRDGEVGGCRAYTAHRRGSRSRKGETAPAWYAGRLPHELQAPVRRGAPAFEGCPAGSSRRQRRMATGSGPLARAMRCTMMHKVSPSTHVNLAQDAANVRMSLGRTHGLCTPC